MESDELPLPIQGKAQQYPLGEEFPPEIPANKPNLQHVFEATDFA